MLREGLIRLIEKQSDLTCCGEAGTEAEAQTAVARHKPDLVILDLRLKGGDGLELTKSLKSQFPDLRILILSQYEAVLYAERALCAGALGYIVKEQAAAEVLNAIRTVLAGNVYVAPEMAAAWMHRFVGTVSKALHDGAQPLTDRELLVLQLLGEGKSTRVIAAGLNVSVKTIESHRENLKRKLELQGAAELVHYASQWGAQPRPAADARRPAAPTPPRDRRLRICDAATARANLV